MSQGPGLEPRMDFSSCFLGSVCVPIYIAVRSEILRSVRGWISGIWFYVYRLTDRPGFARGINLKKSSFWKNFNDPLSRFGAKNTKVMHANSNHARPAASPSSFSKLSLWRPLHNTASPSDSAYNFTPARPFDTINHTSKNINPDHKASRGVKKRHSGFRNWSGWNRIFLTFPDWHQSKKKPSTLLALK